MLRKPFSLILIPLLLVGMSALTASHPVHSQGSKKPEGTPHYKVINLGWLPNRKHADPEAINNEGIVVGRSATDNGQVGFLLANGQMKQVGPFPGYDNANAIGINDKGLILGSSEDFSDPEKDHSKSLRLFLYETGKPRPVPCPSGFELSTMSFPKDGYLNNKGLVVGVGRKEAVPPIFSTFLYDGNTSRTLFTGQPLGINDQGQVLGYDNSGRQAPWPILLWAEGKVTPIGRGTSAVLNNKGQVALLNQQGLFLWENGKLQKVDTTKIQFLACMNGRGQIVGGLTFAALWENGHLMDLNTAIPKNSGWTLITAKGINERGQIICSAIKTGGSFDNAPVYAVLLTPETSAGNKTP